MTSRNAQEQLVHFLKDMYSVEQQALVQMVSAPDLAGDPGLAADFRKHKEETEQQAALVLKRLEAHGESPSMLQGAIMKLGGKGFLLFAQAQPELDFIYFHGRPLLGNGLRKGVFACSCVKGDVQKLPVSVVEALAQPWKGRSAKMDKVELRPRVVWRRTPTLTKPWNGPVTKC